MRDPLQELADEIRKSAAVVAPMRVTAPPKPKETMQPKKPKSVVTVTKGEGGLLFNFGQWTGNPMADNATMMLQRHSDPVQMQIATYQRESMNKALTDFVRTGANPEAHDPGGNGGMHPEWNKQFSKSLDDQVVEGIKNGQIPVEGAIPGAQPGQNIQGAFNKSQMKLNGEIIVGQSETDAAVIEMMKSMPQDDDEFVIDATEGK